jgi:hypothetical protein
MWLFSLSPNAQIDAAGALGYDFRTGMIARSR